jgi:HK97 family phage major capsid protein
LGDELKQAATELREVWESELKPRLEQMETEQKANGEASAETKQSIDLVQDRLDEIEAQFQKAPAAPEPGEQSQEVKDFIEFVRYSRVPEESKLFASNASGDGPKIDPLTETKVLAIRDETLGGVLAPPEFIAEVIKGIVQYSPIRDIARVRQTSRTSVQIPKRTGNFAAQWTAETQTRSETTGLTFGLEEIPTHELYARVLLSNWDLEDPVVNLETEVQEDMSEQFGVAEGSAFVTGNGVGKPLGFQTDSTLEQVNNGAATFTNAVGGDGLINLRFQLKEQYWPNARWVLNRFSLRDIRKLKDNNNNYIWAPGLGPGGGLTGAVPATILDAPYTIAMDMPNATSALQPVAFGDFSRGYQIVDRIEIAVLRDPYTQASAGAVVFHARKRVGGQVILPEAIKLLNMA